MREKAVFMDFEFETGSVTLSPRPETELLVEKACELLSGDLPYNILDVGTGCGNIAISLTKYIPSSRIVALDISDSALRIARENASRYAVYERIEFVEGNLFDSLHERYKHFFDLVISNPPYVAFSEHSALEAGVKNDPNIALYAGEDGMRFYREIIKKAPSYLKEKGILLMEMGYGQSRNIKRLLEESNILKKIKIYRDYSGIERIIKAENG